VTETERATHNFVEGVRTGDFQRMRSARRALTTFIHEPMGSTTSMKFDWDEAMRQIARLGRVPKLAQMSFMRLYTRFGHHIRLEVADDLVLVKALRVLLPPYKGPAVVLYRGVGDRGFDYLADSYHRLYRKRRRVRSMPYGIAWTASYAIADDFAMQHREISHRGSAILQTLAPPESIICCVPHSVNEQQEYIVDTRRLQQVDVRPLVRPITGPWTRCGVGGEDEMEEEAADKDDDWT
jgi:hypothetical protein